MCCFSIEVDSATLAYDLDRILPEAVAIALDRNRLLRANRRDQHASEVAH